MQVKIPQQAKVVFYSLITSAFLSPVLWYWWNVVLSKFVPIVPQVTLWDSALMLIGVQIIPFFLVRRIQMQYVAMPQPVFIAPPTDEEIEEAGKDLK